MKRLKSVVALMIGVSAMSLTACTTSGGSNSVPGGPPTGVYEQPKPQVPYESRLPQHLATHEKTVYIDPNVHAWGAYGSDGTLVKAGIVTAGSDYCPDLGRKCHTATGSFRVYSLGSPNCKSTIYPKPKGGAPMPYCMFFHGNLAMHGTYGNGVAEANLSHGCVRLRVSDAEWLRYNFVNVGTKVVVKPY